MPQRTEWSGSPDPIDPDNFWIDDDTGERVCAYTGERFPGYGANLPAGYSLEPDADGDFWLYPPEDVTIFSVPGEGWLVTDSYMTGRDWKNPAHVEAACLDYLSASVPA
jgi:hypothetical protein